MARVSEGRAIGIVLDEALPFDTESIDTVVVFMVSRCDEPHQAYARRTGCWYQWKSDYCGLQSRNLFGLGWLINRFVFPAKWRGLKLERIPKLMDWLSLLNFQVTKPRHKLVIRPLGNGRLLGGWRGLMIG